MSKSKPSTSESANQLGALDTIRVYLFMFAFFMVLVVFDIVQRVAIRISKDTHQKSVQVMNACLVKTLDIISVETKVEFQEPIPDGQVLIISNHQSTLDLPILATLFYKNSPRFVAKRELGKWIPSVSYNLRNGGNVLIDRDNPREAIKLLKKFTKVLKESRGSPLLFPEGTRAKTGEMKPFKAAGAAILIKSLPDVSIVPVTIDNSWHFANKRTITPRANVRVVVGPTVYRKEGATADELLAHCEKTISENLAKLRKV